MSQHFAFTPVPPAREDAARHAGVVDALTGTWRGRLVDETGASQSFTLLRGGSIDTAVAGRFLFFSAPGIAPTGVKLLEANALAFVALVGPYFDPTEDADVVTVLEGVRRGESIEGSFYTRRFNGRESIHTGCFVASRTDTAHRAA